MRKNPLLLSVFILLIVFIFLTFSAHAQQTNHIPPYYKPSSQSCEFYNFLDEHLGCPTGNNYAAEYGLRYCTLFQEKKTGFGPVGQRWISEATLCLQRQLVSFTLRTPTMHTCAKVLDDAFDSHVPCYTKVSPSVCEISLSDTVTVMDTVLSSFSTDFIKSSKQGIIGFFTCLPTWGPRLKPAISRYLSKKAKAFIEAEYPQFFAANPIWKENLSAQRGSAGTDGTSDITEEDKILIGKIEIAAREYFIVQTVNGRPSFEGDEAWLGGGNARDFGGVSIINVLVHAIGDMIALLGIFIGDELAKEDLVKFLDKIRKKWGDAIADAAIKAGDEIWEIGVKWGDTFNYEAYKLGDTLVYGYDKLQRSVIYESQKIGQGLVYETEKMGDTIAYETEKIGNTIAYEAEKMGNSIVYETEKAGDTIAYETEKIGNSIAYETEKAGDTIAYETEKIGNSIAYETKKMGNGIIYEANKIGDGINEVAMAMGIDLAKTATATTKVVEKAGDDIAYEAKKVVKAVEKAGDSLAYEAKKAVKIAGKIGNKLAKVFSW